MQRIHPAIDVLARELDVEYALASRRLYTDGAELLYDYARDAGDTPEGESARELVVVATTSASLQRSSNCTCSVSSSPQTGTRN